MAKNLLIVESPAKAKTIEGYLGGDFLVKSSFGHVRDLLSKELSVDTENDFEFIKLIFEYFVNSGVNYFSLSQILELLMNNPEWVEINNKEFRRWKGLRGS